MPALPDTPPSVPHGVTVWAVGDIHGRLDLLDALIERLTQDAARFEGEKVVIFLGDYVDRGPESRGVVQRLASLEIEGVSLRFLRGNHEETMLAFLDDPTVGARWCEYGGDATLKSYGLSHPALRHRDSAWRQAADELRHKLTPRETAFLEGLEMSVTIGDYFFVHAGARPGTPLADQTPHDLLWIRRSFLDSEDRFDKLVVHGHTPTVEVYEDHRRIGLDTKAYASGRLTALRLQGADREIIQVEAAAVPMQDARSPAD